LVLLKIWTKISFRIVVLNKYLWPIFLTKYPDTLRQQAAVVRSV
jgi:hypothetical protein